MNQIIAVILQVLAVVETGNAENAVGDHGRSWGCLQIRQCCLDDVYRIQGIWKRQGRITKVVRYTKADCFSRVKSHEIAKIYLAYYGEQYEKDHPGRKVTAEVLARIWNGGPKGYLKSTTIGYWKNAYAVLIKNGYEKYAIA